MTEFFASFLDYSANLPWLELVAMLLALAYVILAAVGSIWCWPAAFISTALYTVVFYDVLLLMDSALNVYYLVMALYGFWVWQKDISTNQNQDPQRLPTSSGLPPYSPEVLFASHRSQRCAHGTRMAAETAGWVPMVSLPHSGTNHILYVAYVLSFLI